MDIWEWLDDHYMNAIIEQNDEKVELMGQVFAAFDGEFSDDPDGHITAFQMAAERARLLNEAWLESFCEHWILQLLLHHKRDYKAALDLAVRAVVKARKAACAGLPQRVCLHEDLISCYIEIDPLGYEKQIEDAMAYMAQEIQPGMECAYCLLGWRTAFHASRERWDEAHECALLELTTAQKADKQRTAEHHSAESLSTLCHIALHRGDWDNMLEWSRAGEQLARKLKKPESIGTLQMWQAVALKKRGETQEAGRLLRAARGRIGRLNAVPKSDYYDALAAYFELDGDLKKALAVREEELGHLQNSGRLLREARVQLFRCRLLKELNLPREDALAAARNAAQKLKFPDVILKELES